MHLAYFHRDKVIYSTSIVRLLLLYILYAAATSLIADDYDTTTGRWWPVDIVIVSKKITFFFFTRSSLSPQYGPRVDIICTDIIFAAVMSRLLLYYRLYKYNVQAKSDNTRYTWTKCTKIQIDVEEELFEMLTFTRRNSRESMHR